MLGFVAKIGGTLAMKYIVWTGIGLFGAWTAYKAGIFDIVILFLLAGALPGTNILLPPLVMFVVLSGMLLAIAYWLKRQHFAVQIRTMKARHAVAVSRPVVSEQAARRQNRQLIVYWLAIILINIQLRSALLGVPGRFSRRWFGRVVMRHLARLRSLLYGILHKRDDALGPKL